MPKALIKILDLRDRRQFEGKGKNVQMFTDLKRKLPRKDCFSLLTKIMKNVLFHLKSFFRFQDIQIFLLPFPSFSLCQPLLEKIIEDKSSS